jgi:hypothetical protein
MRAITCPFTGAVLDVRRAVAVTINGKDYIMTASHWDDVKDGILAFAASKTLTVEILDGRVLYGKSR